jgi:uncharacterized membrane protein
MAIQETSGSRAVVPVRQRALAPAPRRERGAGRRRGDGGIGARIDEERLATGLGWFSIGLGLAELLAPTAMARLVGLAEGEQSRRLVQGLGLRELTSGVGIIANPRPAGWMWSRVAGDLMDLAVLGAAMRADESRPGRLAAAGAAVVGVAALDVLCAQRLSQRGREETGSALPDWAGTAPEARVHVSEVITIARPADELYRYWRDFRNLPRVMRHLDTVEVVDERRSHWRAKGIFGRAVEWDSEVTEDVPNERIAWRSLPGADIDNAGEVGFSRATGGRGTVVRVALEYRPPGGPLGGILAKLFGHDPGQKIRADLHAFKQVLETGEVLVSDATAKGWGSAQPSGRGGE